MITITHDDNDDDDGDEPVSSTSSKKQKEFTTIRTSFLKCPRKLALEFLSSIFTSIWRKHKTIARRRHFSNCPGLIWITHLGYLEPV